MQTKIKNLTAQFKTSLQNNKHDLDQLRILEKEFLGKKGILFELTQELKKIPYAQKAVAGKLINVLKQEIIFTLQKKKKLYKKIN